MDKLSHILNSNGHYHVDLSKERPIRNGVPSFGQPVSKSNHFYESPEEAQEVATPKSDVERQGNIVDKVNFSFARKPETPVAIEKEELADDKAESATFGTQAKAEEEMAAGKESNGHKNVNLSIYV